MTFQPMISVVIPVYNRVRTIEYCLDSVLEQSYSAYEIIVVDDKSSDNTCEIVAKKALNNPSIKLVELQQNSGAQVARNTGIKAAQGDWIAFLDSDDTWKKEKLAMQIAELKKVNFEKNTVVHSNCEINNELGVVSLWKLPTADGAVYENLLRQSGPMFQSMLVSKDAIERIGYLDENIISYQEWDTAIRLAKICNFIHIESPTFTYFLHSGETISKNKSRDVQGYLNIINKYKDEILALHDSSWDAHIINVLQKSISYKLTDKIPSIVNGFQSIFIRYLVKGTWKIALHSKLITKIYIRMLRVLVRIIHLDFAKKIAG